MTDTVHSSDNTNSNQTLNKLRAAVLGANDGVVSISSILMGVAAPTPATAQLSLPV